MAVIPAFKGLGEEYPEFEDSLGCIANSRLAGVTCCDLISIGKRKEKKNMKQERTLGIVGATRKDSPLRASGRTQSLKP